MGGGEGKQPDHLYATANTHATATTHFEKEQKQRGNSQHSDVPWAQRASLD